MTLIEERYELVKERLQDMLTEQAVSEKYTEYFHQMAEFGLLVMQNFEQVQEGWLDKASLQELRELTKPCMRIFWKKTMRQAMPILPMHVRALVWRWDVSYLSCIQSFAA